MANRFLIPVACLMAGLTVSAALADGEGVTAQTLMSSGETILGQQFAYPDGDPVITAAIVTVAPGAETGWHRHDAPMFAYVLEGQITVDYGPDGTRTFSAGETLLEAFKTDHNGINTGTIPVRILTVYAGAEGTANTVMHHE